MDRRSGDALRGAEHRRQPQRRSKPNLRRSLASFPAAGYRDAVATPTPQSERRRAIRALASFPVRFKTKDGGEPALLRDISEIGLACVAPEPIPEMTLVGLDFSLPGASEIHHVQGAVVRCAPMRQARGKHDIAIYFTEVSPVTRAALRNYVAKAKKAP